MFKNKPDKIVESKIIFNDNSAKINNDGSLNVESCLFSGTATGGSNTTLIDSSKNFQDDILINKYVEIFMGNISYIRKITDNSGSTITIDELPGTAASAVIGDHSAGEVTVVFAFKGIGGNSYSIEFVKSEGNNQPLSAALNGLDITVNLATDVNGDLDDTANTATAIAAEIDLLENFSATMTGSGGAMGETVAPIDFSGGIAIVTVSNGLGYKIKSI